MAGITSDTKLCMHFNGADGSYVFTDSSPRHHSVSRGGAATIDTDEKKWGTASLLLDGTADYVYTADSVDWNLCQNDSDSWTIDFQVKMDDQVGNQTFCSHYDNRVEGYYWYFEHASASGFNFVMDNAGQHFSFNGGSISDTNWHHVALIKAATLYGVYLDGSQVAYINTTYNGVFDADFSIGSRKVKFPAAVENFLDGHIDEFRVHKGNYFSASPRSDLADTITVPAEEYSGYDPGDSNAIFFGCNT